MVYLAWPLIDRVVCGFLDKRACEHPNVCLTVRFIGAGELSTASIDLTVVLQIDPIMFLRLSIVFPSLFLVFGSEHDPQSTSR